MINAEELLEPISEDAPCGEDLSYDVSLQELETMARGKEETQFSAAEAPDWKKLQARCLELFARSKDLRIVMTLTTASIEMDGLAGFKEILLLVKGLIERFWPTVYPLLDPSDDNDPLQRMNIVATLATPVGTYGDPLRILERLRALPLTNSVQMGRFSLADMLRAEAGAPPQGDKPVPTTSQIQAGFRDTNPDEVNETFRLLEECILMVQAIDESITNIVGASRAPDLTPLSSELTEMRSRVAPHVKSAGPAPGAAAKTPGSGEIQPYSGVALSLEGEIRSTDDVIKLLDKICQYYARAEPSSPVPLILRRASRLAGKDFMQIMNDLSPDAVPQIRSVTGETEEQ
jgi:type VI secretion system protein ImpA